jgi:hypothetical protein
MAETRENQQFVILKLKTSIDCGPPRTSLINDWHLMASDTGNEFSSDARRSSDYFLSETRQSSAIDEETPSHSTSSTSVSESDNDIHASGRVNSFTLRELLLEQSLLPEPNGAASSEIEYLDPSYSFPAVSSTLVQGDGREVRRISFTNVSLLLVSKP